MRDDRKIFNNLYILELFKIVMEFYRGIFENKYSCINCFVGLIDIFFYFDKVRDFCYRN